MQWVILFIVVLMKVCPHFLHFSSSLDKTWNRRYPQKFIMWLWLSWKPVQWKPQYTYRHKLISFDTFHVYCPFRVKSTYIFHMVKSWWYFVSTITAVMIITCMDSYHYCMFHKRHVTFAVFLRNVHSGSVVGEDQELWTMVLLK